VSLNSVEEDANPESREGSAASLTGDHRDLEREDRARNSIRQTLVASSVLPLRSTSSFLVWCGVVLVGFACLLAALTAHHILYPSLKLGEIADQEIRARKTALVRDELETLKAENNARHSVMPIMKADSSQDGAFLEAVGQQLRTIAGWQQLGLCPIRLGSSFLKPEEHLRLLLSTAAPQATGQPSDSSKPGQELARQRQILQNLRRQIDKVNQDALCIAVSIEPANWNIFSNKVISAAAKICRATKRFPVEDNRFWHETVCEFLPPEWSAALRHHVSAILCSELKPNLVIDEVATRMKSDQVVANVKPVLKEIKKGTVVLAKGSLVTEDNLPILDSVGAVTGINWPLLFSLTLSITAAIGLIGIFLSTYEPVHFRSPASLGLIYTVCILTALVAVAIGKHYPQFVPLPMAALVLTVFFGRRAATVISLPLVALLASDRLIDLNNLIGLSVSTGAAIGTYSKKRHDLVLSSLIIGMMQALGYLASLTITQPVSGIAAISKEVTLALCGGITSAMFAIGLLPFLENIFGLLTPFRLSELVSADQPLLRRLAEEAPGTYQHSLAVANLAEAGAHAINADAALVRAGALYHDIGKMNRPTHFIENQLGAKNPHDDMTPEESRASVLGHVTGGINLARTYGLPAAVSDFIPMHQGTTLMAYFYHKACMRDGVNQVDQQLYRYPGPKPQSKETAIVMLADVSEAVTRSMIDPKQEAVNETLAKVFENRWQDKQFDQSGLTRVELEKIRDAFLRVWRTLHHERIQYPSTTTGRMPILPDNFPTAGA
jgi:putative nucleotidyltransferase with HDIG domain